MFSGLQKDIRFSLRSAARRPLVPLAAVLTLGTAVGGAAAIFTFINGVLLNPLPYPQPERLVRVCETNPAQLQDRCLASPANWADWKRQSRTIREFGLARGWPFGWKRPGGSEPIRGGYATAETFPLFGARPFLGRIFQPSDTQPGMPAAALLSHAFWKTRLGADPGVVGTILKTDQVEAVVTGVLEQGFQIPDLEQVEVWFSFPPDWRDRRDWRGFMPFGRLAPTSSRQEARDETGAIAAALAEQHPDVNSGYGATVVSLHDSVVEPIQKPLQIFMAAAILTLLIAWANTANLLLARTAGRKSEFAIRTALGASQGRLTGQLLAENLILAVSGGVLGALLALGLTRAVAALAPPDMPRFDEVRLSAETWAFAFLASLLACLFLGLVQASHLGRGDVCDGLRSGRGGLGRSSRMGNLFVVAEIGLALTLLIGAGLLGRSFLRYAQWQPGFEVDNLVTAFLTAPLDKYPRGEQVAEVFRQALQEVGSLPGVVSVGGASAGPLFGGGDGRVKFRIEGRPLSGLPEEIPRAERYDMFPSYFATVGIPLRRGRYFADSDDRRSPPVAIVNETLARRYWPQGDPIGQRVTVDLAEEPVTLEIVGVVADVPPFRPDRPPQPEIYWPLAQFPRWGTQLVVRTDGSPSGLVQSIRSRLAQVDADLQPGVFRSMRDHMERQLVRPRFLLLLMSVFAAMGLLMATVGIYGLMAYAVAQQGREFGIRMALGARRLDVFGSVLARGAALALAGIAAGAAGAALLSGLLASLLAGVSATDWVAFAAASVLLGATALAACALPARRATRADPVTALRME